MKIIHLLILSLILVIYSGCYYRYEIVYPDEDKFLGICARDRIIGILGTRFYDDTLRDKSSLHIFFYDGGKPSVISIIGYHLSSSELYELGLSNIKNKKDYIFGKDRKENNIYKVTINADREMIENFKKRGILESDRADILEKDIFILQNYYLEYTEQRIDKKTLITKVEYVLKNKKTHDIAMRSRYYHLYTDKFKMRIDKEWQPLEKLYGKDIQEMNGNCI